MTRRRREALGSLSQLCLVRKMLRNLVRPLLYEECVFGEPYDDMVDPIDIGRLKAFIGTIIRRPHLASLIKTAYASIAASYLPWALFGLMLNFEYMAYRLPRDTANISWDLNLVHSPHSAQFNVYRSGTANSWLENSGRYMEELILMPPRHHGGSRWKHLYDITRHHWRTNGDDFLNQPQIYYTYNSEYQSNQDIVFNLQTQAVGSL
ncbi:hypothetical protein B0T14DRAFT_549259 [Immersiella caudata]|uniref:Uncharacterized protein n=1 Tax=Immersiella caudata TaxID=314043 RepID=A0AA40CAD4_9PEZI|nr:hypothetical protein B0T14DRAFT_549259 [Immersiella caudata]